jgi:PilZ domain
VKQQQSSNYLAVVSEADPESTLAQSKKRGHPRYPGSLDAEASARTNGLSANETVTDASVRGFFVDTTAIFPAGTEVEVRFSWEGRRFRCRAVVTHLVDRRGMGLTFTATDPDQNRSLIEWVNALNDSASAKRQRVAGLQKRSS